MQHFTVHWESVFHGQRRRRLPSPALAGVRMGPMLTSWSARILLDLVRFDCTGGLLTKMEEDERAVLAFQKVGGETVLSATGVGIVLDKLGISALASHLVMNAERLKE